MEYSFQGKGCTNALACCLNTYSWTRVGNVLYISSLQEWVTLDGNPITSRLETNEREAPCCMDMLAPCICHLLYFPLLCPIFCLAAIYHSCAYPSEEGLIVNASHSSPNTGDYLWSRSLSASPSEACRLIACTTPFIGTWREGYYSSSPWCIPSLVFAREEIQPHHILESIWIEQRKILHRHTPLPDALIAVILAYEGNILPNVIAHACPERAYMS